MLLLTCIWLWHWRAVSNDIHKLFATSLVHLQVGHTATAWRMCGVAGVAFDTLQHLLRCCHAFHHHPISHGQWQQTSYIKRDKYVQFASMCHNMFPLHDVTRNERAVINFCCLLTPLTSAQAKKCKSQINLC